MKASKIFLFLFGFSIIFSGQSFAGVKKVVAVADFENKANYGSYFTIGTGMADMLTDALIQSGQFIVLERQALDAVMAEQNLAASNRSAKAGIGAGFGNIKKAQILVQGAVTEFDEQKSSGNQGISLYGVSVGSNSAVAHVAIIIRLIDTTTSEVIASTRIEGDAKAGGLSFSASAGGVNFGQSGFTKTPLGKATQIAIDRAVQFIAGQMQNVSWRGKVIKQDSEGNILVNAGANTGMAIGTILKISRPGESIIDPDSGMELGAESEALGTIKVEEVLPKYCKAKAVYLSKPAQLGDIVEILG